MSNVLDLFDQTVFLGERATGATNLLQCVWTYSRAVDIDGLHQFHRHLPASRLSRRVEHSPLPFGRHRWVSSSGQSDLEVVATPRPRDEFDAWLGEQANTPLDAEHGPGWHLAVLPFTDGGAGVSFVISHCLTDGVGLCEALADAAIGRRDPISWPAAGARRWWHAVGEDTRQFAADIPGIGRAIVAATRFAHRRRGGAGSAAAPVSRPPAPSGRADERIDLPTATIFVDADEWDARAESLGGTSNTLLAGLAALLAQRVGRIAADGSVALTLPVSERTAGDTRANAITNVDFTVDPSPAATDLTEIRAATKHALIRSHEQTNERFKLLQLAPLLPQWLVRRCVGVSANGASGVVSSNLGAVEPAVHRPDGTSADHFVMKPLGPGVTKAVMHRLGGLLVLLSGRTHGQVFVSVLAYQPGRANSNDRLRQDLSSTLSDFSLTASTAWSCPGSADVVVEQAISSERYDLTA
ncbi:wax ester/triacylglycerol synthase domain-containing protein [Mycobacterium sp. OTB74]|jgi:hypothetical protein|uniref:wax ester/triacylglycerol synthase domain-containing protein n=1 Tax=Mycobacterium sp. OTB74 TaxID=1853452 RepID=UPI00247358F4|nr:wax ester/triacylglycerol synthase domain-containing protein [Mycobacterium sp. OTB74]MDH6245565.1 hypothetical protein [Mycobacterium sp. OTB74]